MLEAYKIGVKISLLNHVSAGLMLMGRDFAKTEAHAAALEKRIKNIQGMAIKGGIMLGLGGGALALLKAPLDAAREYELAFTKFKTLNLGNVVNAQADKFARSANLMGVSAKELMTTMSESVGLFGSFSEAQKLAPKIAVLNKANSAIFQGKIEGIDEGSTRSLMKFIDRRGGTKNEASFGRNLDLAQRIVTGSGGFIKYRDLDQFSQMGGTAFRALSDQGILNMALLLQEQGGAKAGTSLMSLYQNLVAGRTPKKTMAMLQEFGLGKLAMQEHATVGGKSLKSLIMTDIKGAELLQSDPATWMRTVFLPALAAKGITSEAGILKATNDLVSNRTASNQASIMTTQLLQLVRDANLAKNAMGVDETIDAYKRDPNSQFANLHARYNGLLVELGISILPMVIRGLEKLIPMVRSLGEWVKEHSRLAKLLIVGFIGLAGAMAFGGIFLLLNAGFRGLGLALRFQAIGGAAGIGNVAMAITRTSTALGALGAMAGVFLAGYAGWKIGGVISDHLSDGEKDVLGRGVARAMALFGNKEAQDALDSEKRSLIASRSSHGRITVHSNVHIDGKKVAEAVSNHQGKAASRPSTGTNSFDASRHMRPVGATGAY